MKKKTPNLITGLFLMFASATATGQSITSDVLSVFPPSPNAASLGKFAETPVSYYTGIPEINIPFTTIQEGDINLPIGLSYHAGGIKVDETASSSGLGWALNAGGVITRSVRGLPDDIIQFQTYDGPKIYNYMHDLLTSANREDFVRGIFEGRYDAESDIYYLNVADINCKFYIDETGQFVVMPKSTNIKIEYGTESSDTWIITDGKGIKYKFDERETTSVESDASGTNGSYNIGSNTGTSSWYLTEIQDTKGNKIGFQYTGSYIDFTNYGTQSITIPIGGSGYNTGDGICSGGISATTSNYSLNTVYQKRLNEITFSDGSLQFVYNSSPRLDIDGDNALQYISLYNNNAVLKKKFHLFTSYFESSTEGSGGFNSDDEFYYRLKLDSLREESATAQLKAYEFYYNPTLLPRRFSYAQDDWGFANSVNNSTPVTYHIGDDIMGADKRINSVYASAASLVSIKYPTGGTVSYEYEGNRIVTNNLAFIGSQASDIEVANLMGDYPINDSYKNFTIDNTLLGGRTTMDITVHIAPITDIATSINYSLLMPDNSVVPLSNDQHLTLAAGNYQLQAQVSTDLATPVFFQIQLMGKSESFNGSFSEINGPGVRIKKITRNFGSQSEVSEFKYIDSTGYSSGLVGNIPDYEYQFTKEYLVEVSAHLAEVHTCICNVFSSTSNYPLVNTRSSYVGYNQVSEYFDDDGLNGKKVYSFTNYDTFADFNSETTFPFTPSSPLDWKRGLPKTEETYRYTSPGNFNIQKKKESAYIRSDASINQSDGIKVGQLIQYQGQLNDFESEYSGLSPANYPVYSDAFNLASDTLITYDDLTAPVRSITDYTYSENNYQIKQIHKYNSDQSESFSSFYYPVDYAANRSSSTLLDQMLTQHFTDVPVEQINTLVRSGTSKITSAILNKYDYFYNTLSSQNQLVLKSIYDNNKSDSQNSAVYDFITTPTRYLEKITYPTFNAKGMPTAYTLRLSSTTAYQWGYNNVYPVAECKNAANDEFFTENFEEASGALTTGGHTGHNYHSGSYTTSDKFSPGYHSRTYVISYWYKSGGNWLYSGELNYTGQTLTGDVDDVRIYPKDAQVITYTYNPLAGVTSMTDARSNTTYYEYDDFLRLLNVKDQYGNIKTHYCYNYAGQSVDCLVAATLSSN